MITTFYPPYNFGGDGIFVHRLSNELAKRGHQVEVIHSIDAYRFKARHEPKEPYQDHPNITVHGLKSSVGFLSLLATHQLGTPGDVPRIRKILQTPFDVIHYHNISLLGPKILEHGKAIKLYSIHEYWLVCPTHALFKFNRAACTRPHCLACSLVYKRPPQWWRYSGMLAAAVKHVDAFMASSRFSKEVHQTRGLDAPIIHLPFFIPAVESVTLEDGAVTSSSHQEPYFLFVGRLERLKGLQTLIPTFRQYAKAQLWIAGAGSYEGELRRLASGCNNIRFLGHLSQRELHTVYSHAIAVIVPSLCFEAFPMVILEAFRAQTPVIARRLGALTEMIEESGGGFVYATDTELLSALDHMLEDPSFRRKLGLSGYQAYQQRWTPDVYLQRYFGLINKIAATRGLLYV